MYLIHSISVPISPLKKHSNWHDGWPSKVRANFIPFLTPNFQMICCTFIIYACKYQQPLMINAYKSWFWKTIFFLHISTLVWPFKVLADTFYQIGWATSLLLRLDTFWNKHLCCLETGKKLSSYLIYYFFMLIIYMAPSSTKTLFS